MIMLTYVIECIVITGLVYLAFLISAGEDKDVDKNNDLFV